MTINLNELSAPFTPSSVKWRVGSTTKDKSKGMALAYADARAFMDRLDEIVGADKWQDEYFDSPSGRVFCKVGIKFDDEWVWKADGAGETQVEGEKGAISDAFKRACVKWGLGRYLYDLDAPWVELEARGSSYAIKKSEYARLNALLGGNIKKQVKHEPEPEPDPAPAVNGKIADLRASIEGAPVSKIGLICDYAFSAGVGYKASQHAFNALKSVEGHADDKMSDEVNTVTALKMFDWLMSRKIDN